MTMTDISDVLSRFETSWMSLLEASKTRHSWAVTTGRFPDGLPAGVFQGGVVGPGKPPIRVDEAALRAAYATAFQAAQERGRPLDQLSARAERTSESSPWTCRVVAFSRADAAAAEITRQPVDGRVKALLEQRTKEPGFAPGWERLSLTRYRGQIRVIRKYPDQKPDDLAVDASIEECLRSADAVYQTYGLRPDYPRWNLLANGRLEIEMSLEPS